MKKVTMWCSECQLWTKDYTESGYHTCGVEVLSHGDGEQPDLYHESEVSEK